MLKQKKRFFSVGVVEADKATKGEGVEIWSGQPSINLAVDKERTKKKDYYCNALAATLYFIAIVNSHI